MSSTQGPSIEHDALAIGSTLVGKYEIRNVLGMGGMGIVYLAENIDIGRTVAIKILRSRARRDAATRERFRQEARACAQIGHPGIVDVLDMGETETGQAFIVMEYLEGETLAARLRQRGSLVISEALSVITEALDAIAAAHAKGIVHRDLKPDNLFLVWRPKWCVKILDFGISKIESDEDVRLTASNMVMGSVLYMPPEQARDARAAGPQADLYSLGAVLYHALTGRPPFAGQNYSEVLSRVLTDPHEPLGRALPDAPPALAALVDQLLSKDPDKRPASARGLRNKLLGIGGEAPRPPAAPPLEDAFAKTQRPLALDKTADAPPPSDVLGTTAAASQPPAALGPTVDASHPPEPRRPVVAIDSVPAAGELTSRTLPPIHRRRWWVAGSLIAVLAAGAMVVKLLWSDTSGPAAHSPARPLVPL